MRRVFVDTSVLFPFSVMDLFLALTEDAVHQVLWTDELLDEWERVIVREQRRAADTAASVVAAIRTPSKTVGSIRAVTGTWSIRCPARTPMIILTRRRRLLHDEESVEVTAKVKRIAGEKTRPPMSPQDVVETLRRAGLNMFPRRIEGRL